MIYFILESVNDRIELFQRCLVEKLQERIEKLILAGAGSAILATLSTVVVITVSFLVTFRLATPDIGAYLEVITEHPTLSLLEIIFGMLSGVFTIPVSISFFLFMRERLSPTKVKILFASSIAMFLGSCLLIVLYSFKISIVSDIAPNYVAAVEPEKTDILNRYEDLTLTTNIIQVIVYILIYTLGAGVYGLFTTQIEELKGTIGWTGLASGIFALGVIGLFIDGTFGSVFNFGAQIGSIMFFFWLVSMAYAIFFLYKEGKKDIENENIE